MFQSLGFLGKNITKNKFQIHQITGIHVNIFLLDLFFAKKFLASCSAVFCHLEAEIG
jgi:hypothetical protein